VFGRTPARVSDFSNPIDFLGQAYVDALEGAVSHGLPMGYGQVVGELPYLRGRLLTRCLYPGIISRPTVLPQETSEFTRDVPLTRILRWACIELARLVSDRTLRIRVSDLAARFAGISDILPSWQMASRLSLPPAQRHFEPSFTLAKLLLLGRSLSPGAGRVEIPGFAFVGWHVFQEYAGRLLREAVSKLGQGWEIEQGNYLVGSPNTGVGELRCKPDFVITRRGRRIICLDAKYTRPMSPTQVPDSPHCAQVITAARAIGADVAVLLHPMPAAQGGPGRNWTLAGEGPPGTLALQPLRPATLLQRTDHRAQVAMLADSIRGWAD
jgi:5-methylcytosine-specific restriction endonuclease McrBC regulatory subunit McrC